MNYPPNTTHWRKGDIVLHDADAKEPRMLMKVIGFTRDGKVKTQYCDLNHKRTIYRNEFKYLHDTKQWGIHPDLGNHTQELMEEYQRRWVHVRRWNRHYPPGITVITTSADGQFVTRTTGAAFFSASGSALVTLETGGQWALEFVQAVPNVTGQAAS